MSQASRTPLLDTIQVPADLRRLPKTALKQVADELRLETIDAVSVTGGHLGAGLGVVELTVALHYVFDTPHDRLVWDVGHQAYPHKILTGRRDRIRTLRQGGGLSGFTKRAESEYDPFGAAHSSTSISAGLGMAVARDLGGESNNVVAVIGDGAMSAGMAYEAMNNAGARSERLIVILNDNDMSIARPVGALSNYLARITSSGTYLHLRDIGKQLAKRLPKYWERRAAPGRGVHAHLLDRRHAVRGDGVLLRRPDRRPRSAAAALGAAQRARRQERADPDPRRHQEGQGLPAGRGLRRQVSRRQQVQRHHRRAGEGEVQRAELHQGVRPEPGRGGAQGRQDRRHHRGHAVRHRARPVRRGVSRAHLRRRHRRAARGDVRRGAGDRRATSRSRRSTPPSCSAPTTRWCTTWRSSACRCASPSTAPDWSAPTGRPMPAPSTWPISAACRASC